MQLSRVLEVVRLIRINQWIKNCFIFVPAFFAQELFDKDTIIELSLGFLLFSLIASCIYILNDYFDIEQDKLHPLKRRRPLASGAISKSFAIVLFIILLFLGLLVSYSLNINFFYLLCFYFVINILYTIILKRYAIIDVTIIAVGFLIRIFSGGVLVNVEISSWLILMTFLLALILAFSKRRGEFVTQKNNSTRTSLVGYNAQFIDVSIIFLAAVTVVSYIMYTMSPEVINRFGDQVYLTSFFVIIGVLRFMQQSMIFNKAESPTKFLYQDKMVKVLIFMWLLTFLLIIYIL